MYCQYRYLIFAFDSYYPSGGFDDFQFGFNIIDEFKENLKYYKNNHEKWYIVDLTKSHLNMTIIGEFDFIDWNKENRELTEEKLIKRVNDRHLNKNN